MSEVTITLDTRLYQPPTAKDITKGKQYVLKRNANANELKKTIDGILMNAVGEIFELIYKYPQKGKDLSFSENKALEEEVQEVLDDAEQEIYELIQSYALNCTEDEKFKNMLLLYILSLGRSNRNLRTTLHTYMKRFMYDIEALAAAYTHKGYSYTTAVTKAKTSIHSVYTQPEVKEAYSVPGMKAIYIASKGIHYDFETGKGTKGISNNGIINVIMMAEATVHMAWMRAEGLEFEQNGAAGYYQLRGSNYPCAACDEQVGFHKGIEGIYTDPLVHLHCCCYRIPIYPQNNFTNGIINII